jgi:hypothetical protein
MQIGNSISNRRNEMATNCKCISEIEIALAKHFKADKVEFQEINLMNGQTFNNTHIFFKGKKKPVNKIVAHTFCPFCGKKNPI